MGALDQAANLSTDLTISARGGFAVTPSDVADLPSEARALYIGAPGATGTLRLVTVGGADITFTGLVAGTILPVMTRRVYALTTTCTGIIALQ